VLSVASNMTRANVPQVVGGHVLQACELGSVFQEVLKAGGSHACSGRSARGVDGLCDQQGGCSGGRSYVALVERAPLAEHGGEGRAGVDLAELPTLADGLDEAVVLDG
jgi:hypothetical protein